MTIVRGTLPIAANFEPKTAAPFDARSLVATKAELLLLTTWQNADGNVYTYIGMTVTVYNDGSNNGTYQLNASDYSLSSNWIQPSSGVHRS